MDLEKLVALKKLAVQRLELASKHLNEGEVKDQLKKAITEEAEIPGFEAKPLKYGQFVNAEFVAMMTDIRRSTEIINSVHGTEKMFLIFYVYSAVVANIVDTYKGTSTEFLGDGVINLFAIEDDLHEAFRNSYKASREILEARELILNPLFRTSGLPEINLGIGIDHGVTIVTRFGYKTDNDLKAFGKCVYNASKLSKGVNEIIVSETSNSCWPQSPNGKLTFTSTTLKDNIKGFKASVDQSKKIFIP
jgi:adenylate cyclase